MNNIKNGYSYNVSTVAFETNSSLFPYILHPESCISFGAVSGLSGGSVDIKHNSDTVFYDDVLPNSEYSNLQKKKDYYDDSSAYGVEIIGDRLDWLKHYLDKQFDYTLVLTNCTTFASDAWNYTFRGNRTEVFNNSEWIILPKTLKKYIEEREDFVLHYEQIMWDKLLNWN